MKRAMDLGRPMPVLVGLLAAAGACASIFGIDDPVLDLCANGGCRDASFDATLADGAPAPDSPGASDGNLGCTPCVLGSGTLGSCCLP